MLYIKKSDIVYPGQERYIDYKGHRMVDLPGHSVPKTRREFFSRIAGAAMGFAILPSLPMMLRSRIWAAECPEVSLAVNNNIPVLFIEFAGGAMFPENFVGLTRDGEFLNNYDQFGVRAFTPVDINDPNASDTTYNVDYRLGYPMYSGPKDYVRGEKAYKTGGSSFLEGFFHDLDPVSGSVYAHDQDPTHQIDLNKVTSFFMAGASNSDTGNNLLGAGPGCAALEGVEGRLGRIFGSTGAQGGGRHRSPFANQLSGIPIQVGSQDAMRQQAEVGELPNLQGMSLEKARAFLESLGRNLSGSQLEAFKNRSPQANIDLAIKCGIVSARDLAGAFEGETIVSNNDPDVVRAFSSSSSSIPDFLNGNNFNHRLPAPNSVLSGLTQLLLNGYAKVGVMQVGGCDEHLGAMVFRPRTRMFQAGLMCRAVVQLAQKLGKPIAICLSTDGGMSTRGLNTDDNTFDYPHNGLPSGTHPGDNDSRCGQFWMISSNKIDRTSNSHMHPSSIKNGKAVLNIGGFTDNGLDTQATPFATSPRDQARMHVWMYAQMNGMSTEHVEKIIGNTSQFEAYRLFNDLRHDT